MQVAQEELERHDGVALGKYTKGLGQVCNAHNTIHMIPLASKPWANACQCLQERMSFPGDQEDVVSMSMTAVQLLLEKNNVDPRDVGR